MNEADLKEPETKQAEDQAEPEAAAQAAPEEAQPQAAQAESPEAPVDPKDLVIAQLNKEKTQLLYQLAEAQSIVRRAREQAELERKFAPKPLVEGLLPVLDGFERTYASAQKGATAESIADGLRVIEKQMRKALEAAGVSRIVSLGAPFDPAKHEALASVENAELDEETVVDEIEAGYIMHDRVIRAAKVRVSTKP